MIKYCLAFAFLPALLLAGCADDGSTPAAAEQVDDFADHVKSEHIPVCTKVGTSKEGWRWADSGKLIAYQKCNGVTPECRWVGTRSEAWYGNGLIAWDFCATVAHVHGDGGTCGPNSGFTCDAARTYCHPADSLCHSNGTCAQTSDCAFADNEWGHEDVPGEAACVNNACVWAPEDCLSTADCVNGKSCIGIPHDGSTPYGKCRSTAHLPGESETCSGSVSCGQDLACVGLSMGPEGMCNPAWMIAHYPSGTVNAASTSVVAYGLATVPVDIVVKAALNKSTPSNLTVAVTDPNGVTGVVCSPSTIVCTKAGLAKGISVEGNSRDDQVNGRWTLTVTGASSAKIKSWELELSSRWD